MTISPVRSTIIRDEESQATFLLPEAQARAVQSTLLVAPISRADGGTDQLCIIAEAVEDSPQAMISAAGVIQAIHDIYAQQDTADPLDTLATAIDTANLALYQQNLRTTPGERILLGLTCLVLRDDELWICQVPPTQLLLSQAGELVALPELLTWGESYQPHARNDHQGLGATQEATPLLFRTTAEQGDLITLCTSNIARQLATEGLALDPLLGTDADAAIEFLAEQSTSQDATAYAMAIAIVPTTATTDQAQPTSDDEFAEEDGAPSWLGRNLRFFQQKLPLAARQAFKRRQTAADEFDHDWQAVAEDEQDDARPTIGTLRLNSRQTDALAYEPDQGWDDEFRDHHVGQHTHTSAPEKPYDPLDEILPSRQRRANPFQALGSLLALPLLVVGSGLERLVSTGERRRPVRQQDVELLENRRRRVWPLGNLERYQPGGLPLGRGLPLLLLAGLLIVIVVLMVSLRNYQVRVEQTRFDTALAQIVQTREAAVASPDRQAGYQQLLALPERLQAIPGAEKVGRQDRIAAEAEAIDRAIDQVTAIQRLNPNAMTIIGALPSGLSSSTIVGRPQIVLGGGKHYLFLNGTVYLADGRGALTKILTKGDMVGGTAVGNLLGIAWRETGLFAYTETQGILRDSGGSWALSPLAASGHKVTAVDSFGGNLYFLEAERGQVVKYPAGSYTQTPQLWSTTKAQSEITQAIDFAVDKDIYLLMADGRVIDLYQGEVKATLTIGVNPPLTGPTAIAAMLDGKWLYILDPREGRIIRVARDGTQITSFKPAVNGKSLVGAREIAADEATNTVYIFTDEGLVSVRLP